MQVDYISHHGIKGQKWGKRLYQYEDGSLTPLGRLRYGKGNSTAKSARKTSTKVQNTTEKPNYSAKARAKNINEMTDAELNSYINRIRLEQTYSQITASPKKISKGKAFTNYVAKNVLLPTATNLAKGTLEYAGKTAINKAAKKQGYGNVF